MQHNLPKRGLQYPPLPAHAAVGGGAGLACGFMAGVWVSESEGLASAVVARADRKTTRLKLNCMIIAVNMCGRECADYDPEEASGWTWGFIGL